MPRFRITFQRLILVLAGFILIAAFPLSAVADDPPACPPASGTAQPTGADAQTYSFNPETCLWENQYYTWDPVSKATTPKYTQTYTYNDSTGKWDTQVWLYNAAAGQYQAVSLSFTQPPAGAVTVGGPQPVTNTSTGSTTPSADSGNSGLSNTNNATVNNTINGTAGSGDALILANTAAGGATSGNAMDMATIINLLQAQTSLPSSLATFTMDVAGDVNHDIIIDPSQLPSSSQISANNLPPNLSINTQANGQINNDVNLLAGSGNATVAYNTTAGDATTGSVDTMANIINVINSIITSGQSFVGTINIKGNLDGDILMPDNAFSNLLAGGASPSLTTSGINGDTVTANFTNTDINNNLNLGAASGNANVTNNTTAGDATSGSASTNVTLLNLTGKQVVGDDALLVFVNVLGKWVGMIVNSPTGSTSAALGNGITSNTSQSGCGASNSTANSSINNNVNLKSTSGDALVDHNTTAGNATSGNATASANILNVACSNLNLNKWLGVLFINVFGSWNGSFGIDTAAGNSVSESVSDAVQGVKVFSLAPSHSAGSFQAVPVADETSPTSTNDSQNHNKSGTILSAVNNKPTGSQPSNDNSSLFWTAGSLFFLGGLLATEELIAARKEARAKFRKYIDYITVQPLKRY